MGNGAESWPHSALGSRSHGGYPEGGIDGGVPKEKSALWI